MTMRLVVLAAALVLAACGSDDVTPVPAADAGAPADASTPAQADAGTPDSGTAMVDPPTGDDDDGEPAAAGPDHGGQATYYAATSTGFCGIKTPSDKLVGAMSHTGFDPDNCGKCARVEGPKGAVIVLLTDKCGSCKASDLDLSTQAFTRIADKSAGRVKITWHLVACP